MESPYALSYAGNTSRHSSVRAVASAASRALRAGAQTAEVSYRGVFVTGLTPADFESTRAENQAPGAPRCTLDTIIEDAIAGAGGLDALAARATRKLGPKQTIVRETIINAFQEYMRALLLDGDSPAAHAVALHDKLRPYLK